VIQFNSAQSATFFNLISTLIKTMAGVFGPTRGDILIGGQSIAYTPFCIRLLMLISIFNRIKTRVK